MASGAGRDLRVAMLGSCVSAQVLRTLGLPKDDLVFSQARLSLASLTQPPGAADDIGPALLDDAPCGPTVRRWLAADLATSVPQTLLAARPDVLVMDLAEERFDLLQTPGGCLVTESWDFVSSGLPNRAVFRQARRIPRLSAAASAPSDFALWDAALERWRTAIAPLLGGGCRLVLLRVPWASEMLTAAGRLPLAARCEIMPGRFARREAHAALLLRCCDRFQAAFPEAIVITPPAETCFADPAHVWGLNPLHYLPACYAAMAAQLRPICYPRSCGAGA
jgi:hypothetical protein